MAAGTSPTLSNKKDYQLFSRTVAPETSKGPALIALMQHNKWARAVILTSTDAAYFVSGLALSRQLRAAGLEVLKPAAFESGLGGVAEIKRSGIR